MRRRPDTRPEPADVAPAILAALRAARGALLPRELARRLEIASGQRPGLRAAIDDLVARRVVIWKGGRIALAPPQAVERRRDERREGERRTARVALVPERVTGVVRVQAGVPVLLPFDAAAPAALALVVPAGTRVRSGDAVAGRWRPSGRPGQGAVDVEQVLGRLEDPGVDARIVACRHGLAGPFPEAVRREAERLPAAPAASELAKRERFDDPPAVTIDGETARDFDDAVAVAALPRGGYRLHVHIADVAHFVRSGSALDREAAARATSVYFPDQVIPMFPERLSNDLCSLRPGEDRLVQTVVLDIDRTGGVVAVRFADGVIRSAARLTYTQVAAILEGGATGTPRLDAMLRLADRLRKLLEGRRRARGSVDFDFPEPEILLDVEGVMTGVTVRPRNRAHRLIEEFMLVANEAVAGTLEARGSPCLYRIHETPDPEKIEALREFAASFGIQVGAPAGPVRPQDIQRLLDAVEGKPEQPILAQVALRSMKQARYAAVNAGHFGLAAPVYAHFTSPIRRYPDLVVHRLLRATRRGRRDAVERLGQGIEATAEACSRLERAAEAAERELLAWKKIAFIRSRIGDRFDAVVTAVLKFGVFVQLTENLVEGLVHVARLGADRFEFDERRHELRGLRTGARVRLGDRMRVVLDQVDPVLRRVDLSPEQPIGGRRPARRS